MELNQGISIHSMESDGDGMAGDWTDQQRGFDLGSIWRPFVESSIGLNPIHWRTLTTDSWATALNGATG